MDDHLLVTVFVGGLILLAFTFVNVTRFGALTSNATAPFTYYQGLTAGIAFLVLTNYVYGRGYLIGAEVLLVLSAIFLVVSLALLVAYYWREFSHAAQP